MIRELTPEQKARFPEFVEKWTKIGLCTEPANRPEAEKGINLAYEIAGLEPPEEIIWCESPLVMIHHMVDYVVSDSVYLAVDEAVTKAVLGAVDANVYRVASSAIFDAVFDAVYRPIAGAIYGTLGQTLLSIVDTAIFSIALYDYFAECCGLKVETAKYEGIIQITKNAGWWLPCEKVCFVSERYNRVMLNERGQAHYENGSAIEYRDGFAVYAINGVGVPEQVVMSPQTLNPKDILHEPNAEVQRVMIERFGEERFILECGVKPIHQDDFGSLYRINFDNGDEPLLRVHVIDPSTGRKYWLGVPPAYDADTLEPRQAGQGIQMKRSKQAVAWSFGMREDEYNPDIET